MLQRNYYKNVVQDHYYVPLAGNISRKERKERIKEHGHLNISQGDGSMKK